MSEKTRVEQIDVEFPVHAQKGSFGSRVYDARGYIVCSVEHHKFDVEVEWMRTDAIVEALNEWSQNKIVPDGYKLVDSDETPMGKMLVKED